jgi:hypothetical protein
MAEKSEKYMKLSDWLTGSCGTPASRDKSGLASVDPVFLVPQALTRDKMISIDKDKKTNLRFTIAPFRLSVSPFFRIDLIVRQDNEATHFIIQYSLGSTNRPQAAQVSHE